MSYIYNNDKDFALVCLNKAYMLSNHIDIEAARLKGQILLEIGKASEARVCFQEALQLQPNDPLTLACLAMSLSALGYKAPVGSTNFDYRSKLQDMSNMSELSACVDPEELFQASIFTNLNDILVRKRLEKLRNASRKTVNISAEGALSGEVAQASPEIYYWYGMYHMKKGTAKSYAKAKLLFTEAGKHLLTYWLTHSLTN